MNKHFNGINSEFLWWERYHDYSMPFSLALNIFYVKDQTREICLAAVKKEGYALKHIKNQTPEICHAAICNNPIATRYVRSDIKNIMGITQ